MPPVSWRTPIAATALALVMGFASFDASALALGRVTVLSSLGEPLRAEIEVPEITAEEAASLRLSVASPDAFRAAGLEFNAALGAAQISLQRRANGSAFLRLSSDRSVNEPFVDLILEASWASGRIVRDYTMLFDPASLRQAAAPVAATPATSAPIAAASSAPAPAPSAVTSAPAPSLPARRTPTSEPKPAPVAKPPAAAPKGGITVKPGDTAAALAAQFKPTGVSLDQMLVAMLRASPEAFVNGNVNRLKAGAVIDMQEAASGAPSTAVGEAKQTIVAQAKDFNEFRRRLAAGAPSTGAAAPNRVASGKVQTKVNEPKAQASAPDKLTLSKGAVAAKSKEEAIAKEKQAKDNAARVAELSKNIQELSKLGTTTTAKPGPATAPAAPATGSGVKIAAATPSVPIAPTVTPPATPAPATAPVAAATTSTPTSTATSTTLTSTPAVSVSMTPTATMTVAAAPSAPASSPTSAAAPVAKRTPPPPPPPEPTFIESLMDNPAVLPGAGALLAALGGLAFWRIRRRKNGAQVDSSFLESRLQPDSFFGASGGQRVDTADSASNVSAGSSMVYSPSQLDAAGDVDPVAEADVYLAYGRDLQAEEILKEAMRSSPSRVAIHGKLLEIYSKRRDVKAFETVAKEAYNLTQGEGPQWQAASALGRELDPSNNLYIQGNAGSSASAASTTKLAAAAAATAAFSATKTVPQQAQSSSDTDFDLDLDLDFSAEASDPVKPNAGAGMVNTPKPVEPTVALRSTPAPEPMVDFDMSQPGVIDVGLKFSEPDIASLSNGLNFSSTPPVVSAPTAPMSLKTGPSEPGALEFDLGGISLDLPGDVQSAAADDLSGDPLETKLALALEFRDIGDSDGARSLVQEVADEASGALKARAMKMLADLG
jgi:pilus assembly protein FimV